MNIDYILHQISKHYKIDLNELTLFVSKLNNSNTDTHINIDNKISDIILPFCGFIDENKCNGVVYNHGLYTQCNNLADDLCKKCKSNKKYGTIQERAKYDLGKFTPDGIKYEVPYDKFIKKMKYDLNDVKNELARRNLSYPLIENLKQKPVARGRPKKNIISVEAEEGMEKECRLCQDSEEEIEVEKVEIEERWYYKTNEDVLLDIKNHNICGILVNGKIKSIDNK